jgi:hypothetical protein
MGVSEKKTAESKFLQKPPAISEDGPCRLMN